LLIRALASTGITALAACASGGRSPSCVSAPEAIGEVLDVYYGCAVDRPVSAQPLRVDMPDMAPPATGCFHASVQFVVDTNGRVINSTAMVVETNNARYGEAVLAEVVRRSYRPAQTGGRKVRQLVRDSAMVSYEVVLMRAGASPPRPMVTC
jgi:hypothetical protein